MNKALIIPAKGIGDALLMMIASHRLLQEGYQVYTQHQGLEELKEWFPDHKFSHEENTYDLVIVENDNSSKIGEFRKKFGEKLSIFYPTYNPQKHPPLSSLDQVFDHEKPMADNIAYAIARILKSRHISKNNGIVPLAGLTHQAYKKRVLIHPASSSLDKNWLKKSYLNLSKKLKKRGFEPLFVLAPHERNEWPEETPLFPTLSDLAKTVYESAFAIGNDSLIGHLASNFHIPTLIIASCPKRMQLWRPGWLLGAVLTPPPWIPRPLRKKYWKNLISPNRVLESFLEMYDFGINSLK